MKEDRIKEILKDDLEKGLNEILTFQDLSLDEKNEIYLLYTQLSDVKKEFRLNLIDVKEKNQRIDKIRFSILEFLKNHENGKKRIIPNTSGDKVNIKKSDKRTTHQSSLDRLKGYFNIETKWKTESDPEGTVKSKFHQKQIRFFVIEDGFILLFDYEEITDFVTKITEEEKLKTSGSLNDCETHYLVLTEIRFNQDDINDIKIIEVDEYKTINDLDICKLRFVAKNLGMIWQKEYYLIDRFYHKDLERKVTGVTYQEDEGKFKEGFVEYFELDICEKHGELILSQLREIFK